MSSSEDSDAGQKRKRKVQRLEDSSANTSSGSPILGNSSIPQKRRHRKVKLSSTDSDNSPILNNHRKKIMKITTDSESGSSDESDIGHHRISKPRRLETDSDTDGTCSSQWESDFSDQETESLEKSGIRTDPIDSESELSDNQSEKCPICLISFKLQEIGTPESCDHTFCLECIQEWSKNMNTCPVDRQEYSLILVRDHLNGKIIKQIPIERPVPVNEVDIIEDLTFCEICGSNEHEDRMLLCDGCNLGFHLFCLTPPLTEVPMGHWYCNDCAPDGENSSFHAYDFQYLNERDVESDVEMGSLHRRNRSTRLISRTGQTERVRRRVENNRHNQNSLSESSHQANLTEESYMVSSSTSRRRKKPRKSRSRKIKYKTVYEIDEITGETVAVKKRMKKIRKRRSERTPVKPKTVKKRLAQQLGICAPRNSNQNFLPDVKIPNRANSASSGINGIRNNAGIPTLHLFGQNNDLDYFSDEQEDYSLGGSQVMIRRAPNRTDVANIRRTIRRKNVLVPEVVSSTSDLLDTILNSQEQLYSRNASYSIDSSGKFKVESKYKSKGYIDVTKEQAGVKETPYYNPNRNYNRYNQNYRPYQNRYQRPTNNYYNSNNQYNYNTEPSSSMNYSNDVGGSGGGGNENDYPQDYSRRTLSASAESNLEENQGEEVEQAEPNPNDDSELDIYSDIETVVTTTKTEDGEYRPLSPPPMPNFSNMGCPDEDNNDSEPDMVIDDEKIQDSENQNEYNKEETAVSSTVSGFSRDYESVAEEIPTVSNEIQSGAVQSSLDTIKSSYQYFNEDSSEGCPNTNIYSREVAEKPDEDADSDDGCPNFSIYSKESKTMALHTDVTLSVEKTADYQIGEVSSSPNSKTQDPQNRSASEMYDPEETFNEESQDANNITEDEEETPKQLDNIQTFDENTPNLDKDAELNEETQQLYDPEKIFSPERNTTLDHTYDPDNCMRTDETLNTDVEKTLDADQSYDPENIYDENSNSNDKNVDFEEEIFHFNKDTTAENRYDPAIPFTDDLDETSRVIDAEDREMVVSTTKIKKIEKDVTTKKKNINDRLYSDSEDDESVVKKDGNSFVIADINNMTEDISEEERSYTPCLDEKSQKQGLEGLDTEMISDEDRNDFDESHDLKTVSDGDALEINAKESEMDFTRPEDYEEGEIVDKNKDKEMHDEEAESEADKSTKETAGDVKKTKKKDKDKPSDEKNNNKENEVVNKDSSFKRLSKSNRDRNYRDKERRQTSPKNKSTEREHSRKEKKREKRKELERYNVRAIIAEKPRPLIAKDQFGRDIRNTPSRSRSRSYTPPPRSSSRPLRSPSKSRRSVSRLHQSPSSRRRSSSKEKPRKRRKSRNYRSATRSVSKSPPAKKETVQKPKKRKRTPSRYRKRKSDEKSKKRRLGSRPARRSRSTTPVVRRAREREIIEWSPISQSQQVSPSWTPPRLVDNSQLLRNESLTVTVNNSKKKKDKKKRGERRNKESALETRQRKRRYERERTPPPSKEVFASGDNILVSVSFNNESEIRDITTRDKRKNDDANKKRKKRKNKKDLTGVKPVAIIDLDKSPFRELTPSPKQIIVLTDSENEEGEEILRNVQGSDMCDSSQQVASPERGIGPKTPPEPQVKFSLAAKPAQIRAITNPLIDPEEIEINNEEEISSRMIIMISPGVHKGPNTPPDPPNSAPSSPDAYDPFEPTKSRSPTPDLQTQSNSNKDSHESIDSRAAIDMLEKSTNPMPENTTKSLTPPLADIQPADSQSSVQIVTPTDSNLDKSPDSNQIISSVQQNSKPVAQTVPFSSLPTPINSSTPISTNLPPSRINILNTTVISPPVASPIPQRIVLPNQIKSSSVKISPMKTPIKPIPNKTTIKSNTTITRKKSQNGGEDLPLDFDSPYSPGSSDYEDLFEPPSEIVTKPVIKGKTTTTKSPLKHSSTAFDVLFGGSPTYNNNVNVKQKKYKYPTKKVSGSKTKTVGVKLDEDNLKILDELPNSAVEMQVKDKFLKKLNRQERVVEEVKLVLKPHYNKKKINKEEYKDILRRSVPKICHNKSGEINPTKIKNLIEAYVRKIRHSKKVTSSSSVNPLKI